MCALELGQETIQVLNPIGLSESSDVNLQRAVVADEGGAGPQILDSDREPAPLLRDRLRGCPIPSLSG